MRDTKSICHLTWKQPMMGQQTVRLVPHLSGGWTDGPPQAERLFNTYRQQQWSHPECTIGVLENQRIAIEGLDGSITDVFVRIDYGDGRMFHTILRPGDPPLTLTSEKSRASAASAYLGLGIEHILEGVDHLSFVLALILLIGFTSRLAVAVTGFTLAHSVTLLATALGLISPWSLLIEALVALSIAFVAAEVLRARRGSSSLTIRWPILAAIGFGLIHGFAFAGALGEIGLPPGQSVLALALFNLGVELGQILFVVFVMAIAALAVRAAGTWKGFAPAPAFVVRIAPYAIGSWATYWFLDRTAQLFV
ncbi:HupE/UreJ family protein [Croceicoccus estronivorus]|uniref:HupE/UreJ family protein n=1 Tax=Croceicoccus estronivorus TaxID=1172626 RepID=UPI001478D51B|nr:HupE/UreJ family protein [Croceicoccus estronivorus]